MSIKDKVGGKIGEAVLGVAMSLIVFIIERKLKKTLREQESRSRREEVS
jgi:hypothetical protein